MEHFIIIVIIKHFVKNRVKKNNCYNLLSLIEEYSKHNCIDLFTETRLDDRLRKFNYYRLSFKQKPQQDHNFFYNIINDIFLKMNLIITSRW